MQHNTRFNTLAMLLICGVSAAGLAQEPAPTEWTAPFHLGPTVNSVSGDFFPALSGDGSRLYFTVTTCPATTACVDEGFGGWDIFVSVRNEEDDTWGPRVNLGGDINLGSNDGAPALSADGRLLFFASNRAGGVGGSDIYVSYRTNVDDDLGWQAPVNLGTAVNSLADENGPELYEDKDTGLRSLYFDSNRVGGPGPVYPGDSSGNGNDIYVSPHDPVSGAFRPATLLAELSTVLADRQPAVRRDGLALYLTSNRVGTLGFLDLWVSTRASTTSPWSIPVNLGTPVNTAARNEAGAALSYNGKTLVYQTIPPPGGGSAYDLWASKLKKVK